MTRVFPVALKDLDPQWLKYAGRVGIGLAFTCPKCHDHAIGVLFENPLDGCPPVPRGSPPNGIEHEPGPIYRAAYAALRSPHWKRTGDAIERLTLTPSIDVRCWHGFVTGGVTTVAA